MLDRDGFVAEPLYGGQVGFLVRARVRVGAKGWGQGLRV
jgi:hypothetical protein